MQAMTVRQVRVLHLLGDWHGGDGVQVRHGPDPDEGRAWFVLVLSNLCDDAAAIACVRTVAIPMATLISTPYSEIKLSNDWIPLTCNAFVSQAAALLASM